MAGTEYEVAVAGGGIAGPAVAALLAGRGHHVVLVPGESYDEEWFEMLEPGVERVFGDLGRNLVPDAVAPRGNGEVLIGFGAQRFRPMSYAATGSASRSRHVEGKALSALLVARARERGVEVLDGALATAPLVEDGAAIGFECFVDGQPRVLRARVVVDATGAPGLVPTAMGAASADRGTATTASVRVHEVPPAALPFAEAGPFGYLERLPAGRAWLWYVPSGDAGGGLAFGSLDRDDVPATWPDLLAGTVLGELFGAATPAGAVRTSAVPGFSATVCGRGWIALGDAAGVDPGPLASGASMALLAAQSAVRAIELLVEDPADRAVANTVDRCHREVGAALVAHSAFWIDPARAGESDVDLVRNLASAFGGELAPGMARMRDAFSGLAPLFDVDAPDGYLLAW
ncbi:NAD(P)/FAD-dependent oxidoreductase [Amycolatopsis minnesotensis]|uniref:FAD-dependent oxidoreductase 2 FAD-binding domain-containing protein n=1 Tax=Amycolatopsis minnesotensis TaxID=337894 RepID=A0ABN2RQ46_9PSEU